MNSRLIIDGNAFYEVDDDCLKRKREQEDKEEKKSKDSETKKRSM